MQQQQCSNSNNNIVIAFDGETDKLDVRNAVGCNQKSRYEIKFKPIVTLQCMGTEVVQGLRLVKAKY